MQADRQAREVVNIRIDHTALEAVEALARVDRRTRSDMLRILIDEALGARGRKRTMNSAPTKGG